MSLAKTRPARGLGTSAHAPTEAHLRAHWLHLCDDDRTEREPDHVRDLRGLSHRERLGVLDDLSERWMHDDARSVLWVFSTDQSRSMSQDKSGLSSGYEKYHGSAVDTRRALRHAAKR